VSRLKLCVQEMLRQLGFYHRVKASFLYDLYWLLADVQLLHDRRSELNFYRDFLRGFHPGDLIFDVGANYGVKTDIFLRLGARVVAVEPDEANKSMLQERFLKYRLVPKPVVIVQKAVSDSNVIETMWIDSPGSAMNTLSRKWVETLRSDDTRFGHAMRFAERKEVATTTLEELFAWYGRPFYIKLDVEGYELTVLRGLRRPVPYISFEVNLPEFRPEGVQCIELLARLAADCQFNYAIDCRRGMAQEEWLGPEEFLPVLLQCNEKSIEVFGKTSLAANPEQTLPCT
jgi:FkbM family methyltransferase